MVVCNVHGDGKGLEFGEPGAAGAHMRCSARVCNPVRISMRVGQASKADTCAGGELGDVGAVGWRRRQGGGSSAICTAVTTVPQNSGTPDLLDLWNSAHRT
jgi:hypothetical protein